MDALWPNVSVGEDGLFQCVREVRIALADHRREMVRLVAGRGYLLSVEVTNDSVARLENIPSPTLAVPTTGPGTWGLDGFSKGGRRYAVAGLAIGILVIVSILIVGVAIAVSTSRVDTNLGGQRAVVVTMPIIDASDDPLGAEMASAITARMVDGLARIDTIRVLIGQSEQPSSPIATKADFVMRGELQRAGRSWTLQTRIIRTATGEVLTVDSVSVDGKGRDLELQQSRLASGAGHLLAGRLNDVLEGGDAPLIASGHHAGDASFAIDQANASINQTSFERFGVAEAMLQDALAAEPENVDLAVALAGLQLRGIQMVWYTPEEAVSAQAQALAALVHARSLKPDYIPVAETYCRFLSATNRFVESLMECSRTLSLDPWDGLALYHVGLGQLYLGRFDDALTTFQQADRIDTPPVSRWTWLLGAGWANLMLGRAEASLPWIQRSIAITPASGRSHMLLAAAYQQTGRIDDAKAAMREGLRLRPGSTALNVAPSSTNASPVYVQASRRLIIAMVQAGLPER